METAKISVWGNIWKRDIHRERNLVVAKRNSESSGLKKRNVQAVPDEKRVTKTKRTLERETGLAEKQSE